MTKFGMAQPVRRVEDPRLLKGDGSYTDDSNPPGHPDLIGGEPHSPGGIHGFVQVFHQAADLVVHCLDLGAVLAEHRRPE